jgi:hypothetical protein
MSHVQMVGWKLKISSFPGKKDWEQVTFSEDSEKFQNSGLNDLQSIIP